MSKHIPGDTCPSCDEKLKQAHPDIADWFYQVKKQFKEAHIAYTWRNEFDQNRMVAEGKSKLPWPKSKHNNVDENGNPYSLAVDLFELASNGMACWRWRYFKDIADQFCNNNVDWGGNWEHFKDSPHFELNK